MSAVENPNRISLFDGLTLDLARGCVSRSGEEIHLRPQTYEVLRYLVQNRGRLISKDKLIQEVWKGRAVTDGSLGKCIEELRDSLGPAAKHLIRNVRGRGYILDTEDRELLERATLTTQAEQIDVVRVTVEEHEEFPEHILSKPLPSTLSTRSSYVRTTVLVVAAVLVVGIGIVMTYRLFSNGAATSTPITSIAVMPFKNESGNSEGEYLSDGMTESLINRLSQLPQLKVIAQNSTFEYKGKQFNPQEVSNALGVQAILTGRLIQRGDDLVVSVELIDTRDKTQVWGERYTRKAADIQEIQEDISHVISEKLRLRLTGTQEVQLTRRATQNSQAYQFYLSGLYHLRQVRFEDTIKARDYFEKSVTLDPNFALAWVGIANSSRKLAGNSVSDPKEPQTRARAATGKALALDDTLAEAHVELAGIKRDEWDWVTAEREYRRALELNPNLVEAHLWYSSYLSVMGRHSEALAEIKRAQELDPLSSALINREVMLLYLARRYDEAEAKLKLHRQIDPDNPDHHLRLGLIYAARGMYEKAVGEYQQGFTADDEMPWRRIILGHALAMSGRKKEAQAILDKLETSKQYVSPTELASLYLALGDKEGAMVSLERAYAAHDLQLQNLRVDSFLDDLRSDPRFQDLMRRVGLPA